MIDKSEEDGPDAEKWADLRKQRDENKKELKKVVKQHDALQTELDRQFNPYWGMVFKKVLRTRALDNKSKVCLSLYQSSFKLQTLLELPVLSKPARPTSTRAALSSFPGTHRRGPTGLPKPNQTKKSIGT